MTSPQGFHRTMLRRLALGAVLLQSAFCGVIAAQTSAELVLQTGHAGFVSSLTFSTDGTALLTRSDDGGVRVWDLRHDSIVRAWDRLGEMRPIVTISRRGDKLLTGSPWGSAESIDVATGKEEGRYVATIDPTGPGRLRGAPISAAAESPDANWVVAGNADGEIVAFATRANRVQVIQHAGAPPAMKFRFNAQSTRVAYERLDGSLIVHDFARGSKLGTGEGFQLPPTAEVGFSPSGHLMMVDTANGVVLTDMVTGESWRAHCRCVHAHISGDGTRIAALEGDSQSFARVRLWSTDRLAELRSWPSPAVVYRLALSHDGKAVAFGGFDGSVAVGTAAGVRDLTGRLRTPKSLALLSSGDLVVVDTEGGMRLWRSGLARSSMIVKGGNLSRTTISTEARFVAMVGRTGTLRLFNLQTRESEDLGITMPEHGVRSLWIDEDGDRVVWAVGSVQIDMDASVLRAFADGRFPDRAPVSADFNLYTATRQAGWKPEAVCRGASPLAVSYRGELVVANCPKVQQSVGTVPSWKVDALAVRHDRLVLAGSGKIMIRDSAGTAEVATECPLPTSVAISPNGRFAALMCASGVTTIDLENRRILADWRKPFLIPSFLIALSDGAAQVAVGDDGEIDLLDGAGAVQRYTPNGKPLSKLISVGDDEWLVVDEAGRFDTSDVEQAGAAVKWRSPDEPKRVLPIEIFMSDYFTPRLLRTAATPGLPRPPDLASLNRIQPEVNILRWRRERGRLGRVAVDVKVRSVERAVQRGPDRAIMRSGVFDLRLFRDGQLVAEYPDAATVPARRGSAELDRNTWRKLYRVTDAGEKIVTIRNLAIPRRTGVRQAIFTAYAFNGDRVKSETSPPLRVPVEPVADTTRRAYLITMAVNANQSGWDLTLAVPSAERATELWSNKLRDAYDVVAIRLESRMDESGTFVPNATATKANLKATLDMLAGRVVDSSGKVAPATPDDAVVLYVASHGYADPHGHFYIVPFDSGDVGVDERKLRECFERTDTNCSAAKNFLDRAISVDELAAWWRGVDAGELVLILDSCHSASAPGPTFRPGPLGDRGFGQLSYDKGMIVFAAAQPDQTAKATQRERLGHTLLVESLQLAAEGSGAGIVPWLRAAERMLPDRARNLYGGQPEEVQLPELMDFASRRRSAVAQLH